MSKVDANSAIGTNDTSCQLCGRIELSLIRHQLIPRSRHTKARTQ